jgi:alpha-beta hydrolase superfamily lysophospholipase
LGTGIAKYALQQQKQQSADGSTSLPLFLVGSSMGGTIALAVAQRLQEGSATITDNNGAGDPTDACPVAGVVLLAPMLKLRVGELERHLLHGLSLAIPTWEVIPSTATSADKQYRDPSKRDECESDPYKNTTGKIRVMSAYTCVDLCHAVQGSFAQTSVPFLVMVADQDVVVDSQGSLDLFEQSSSKDKELKRYDALHGLLCEPPPLIETIQSDFLQWIRARTPQ